MMNSGHFYDLLRNLSFDLPVIDTIRINMLHSIF
jgi:hypothetical protein